MTNSTSKTAGRWVHHSELNLRSLGREEIRYDDSRAGARQRKGVQAGMGIGIGGVGAVVAVLGLATVLAAWLAALIVGAALLALAGVVSAAGISQVRKSAPPVPEQAVQSTKRDIETVKESMHS